MEIAAEDVRDLVDAGFIAWSRGLDAEAARIFEAARLLRPNKDAGHIGAALVRLRANDPEAAVELLRKAPPTDVVRAFLGLALLRVGERHDGFEMLEELIADVGDASTGRLARSILDAWRAEAGTPPLA